MDESWTKVENQAVRRQTGGRTRPPVPDRPEDTGKKGGIGPSEEKLIVEDFGS